MKRTLLLALVIAANAGTTRVAEPAQARQLHQCPRTYLHDIYGGRDQCLSVARRKHLYYVLVGLMNRGNEQAYSIVSRRFRVSIRALRRIRTEGERKHWPIPPLPGLETVSHANARSTACFRAHGARVVKVKSDPSLLKNSWLAWWGDSWQEGQYVNWRYVATAQRPPRTNSFLAIRGPNLTKDETRYFYLCL